MKLLRLLLLLALDTCCTSLWRGGRESCDTQDQVYIRAIAADFFISHVNTPAESASNRDSMSHISAHMAVLLTASEGQTYDVSVSRLTQIVAVVALCAVASACNSASGTPQDPAISLARDIGVALPLAQYEAFADGVIEFAEVESAADRLRTCVSDGGVTSFTFTVGVDGYQASHSGDEGDTRIAERCRVEHFDATYQVFQTQSTPTP